MLRYLGLHRDNFLDAVRRLRRQPFATLLTVLVIPAIYIALRAPSQDGPAETVKPS